MKARELIVLSSYQLPAQHTAMFATEDVECLLNGYTALWHPAALRGAIAPPRVASPYDFEQPSGQHIYAVPESPPLFLPEDWDQRAADAGAIVFRCGTSRQATLAAFQEAVRRHLDREAQQPPEPGEAQPAEPAVPELSDQALLELEPAKVAPFFGLGFGFLMVNLLFEAMEHENLLAVNEFWQQVQEAIDALGGADPDACRARLQSAAEKLAGAREVLYSAPIHLLDIVLLDEDRLDRPWPAGFRVGSPVNFIAPASLLEKLARDQPDRLAELRTRVQAEQAEVCGGTYLERADALLPVESQLWNLLQGMAVSRDLLGTDIHTFARKRFFHHPHLPTLLNQVGISKCLLLSFDAAVLPSYRTPVISWPAPDGKHVDAFTRAPFAADDVQTFFHFAHYLKQTIMQDHSATLALVHRDNPAAPWYEDLLALQQLGPVLGEFKTFRKYFADVMAGEYASAVSAEEFHSDYLEERTNQRLAEPVSGFARHLRQRRLLEAAWTFAGLYRSLAGPPADGESALEPRLAALEQRLEAGADPGEELAQAQQESAQRLAGRLLSRAQDNNPGYLLLNPCSFARRVAVEIDGLPGPLAMEGPIKAAQFDGDTARLVVEVPALGFAWFPRSAPAGTKPPAARMVLADKRGVRNEFFEAEVDPVTGGLRGLWDPRTRLNRIGQQLVFNPGSTPRVEQIQVVSSGPALGEVVSEGVLLDPQEQVLARFRQRFRAWLSRPLLEMRIEVFPERPPQGYPWHNYYGARFAWRDERTAVLKGVNGTSYLTTHTRPETPDYLEFRLGRMATALFPGGLPFHQRHGGRMLDVILLVEGETARTFDLALALDRDHPMHTAMGMVSPATVVPTTKGPPHVGAAGWLYHLDATNLLLTSMRPVDGAHAVIARLLECRSHSGPATFRCVRDPKQVELLDARGNSVSVGDVDGDSVIFDVTASDLLHVRFDFD